MFTLFIKTVFALFPFIKEIVDSSNRGPRDRRAKNPLTAWLVITLVFMVAAGTTTAHYVVIMLDKEHSYTVENVRLKHMVELNEDTKAENLALLKDLRASQSQLDQLRAARTELANRVAELTNSSQVTRESLAQATATIARYEERNNYMAQELNNAQVKLQAAEAVVKGKLERTYHPQAKPTTQPKTVKPTRSPKTDALLRELTNKE